MAAEVREDYLKVLSQQKDDRLDPVAGEVSTAALEPLVREPGFALGGVNPVLIG